MVYERTLVLIKPDGLVKSLTGNIISALSETKLKIVGAKVVKVTRELAEKHYRQHKESKPHIFENIIKYIMGEYHNTQRVLALVYAGENAVKKVRKICGSTNPEKAHPVSIRGRYGRVNSKTGVWENAVHSSESPEAAKTEISLWFSEDEIIE